MDPDIKKEELDIETSEEKTVDNTNEQEVIDNIEIDQDDPINVDIPLENINDLTEEECDILFVKIEVAIDKCEMDLDEFGDVEKYELAREEIKRLKNLEKLVHKQKNSLTKGVKEEGFFGNLPTWAFVLFIICALFTIVPVNPYLPVHLFSYIAEKIEFMNSMGITGVYIWYFTYIGFFLLIEIVMFIILLIRGIKSKEKMGTFKAYLLVFIINVIIDVPGLVLFLKAALNR